MKKIIFIISFFIVLTQIATPPLQHYITASRYCCGRLGDQFLLLTKLLYLAEENNLIPFYLPWPELDAAFAINAKLPVLTAEKESEFSGHSIWLDDENQLADMQQLTCPKLYVASIRTNLKLENVLNSYYNTNAGGFWEKGIFEYSIAHPSFAEKLKALLTPVKQPNATVTFPADAISVAVHVRKGSSDDPPLASVQEYSAVSTPERLFRGKVHGAADTIWALKFPPDQYYIDQIIKLSELLDNRKLYVHIFTDDKNPEQLMLRYKKRINKKNIIFNCNKTNESAIDNIFQMTQYDCIIGALSNFVFTAYMLGNHKIIILPINGAWHDTILHFDEVKIIFPNRATRTVTQFRFDDWNQKLKNSAHNALRK